MNTLLTCTNCSRMSPHNREHAYIYYTWITIGQLSLGFDSALLWVQESAVVEVQRSLHTSTGQGGAGLWYFTFEPCTASSINHLHNKNSVTVDNEMQYALLCVWTLHTTHLASYPGIGSLCVHIYYCPHNVYIKKHCHSGARQASDSWTAAVSSLWALISREYA